MAVRTARKVCGFDVRAVATINLGKWIGCMRINAWIISGVVVFLLPPYGATWLGLVGAPRELIDAYFDGAFYFPLSLASGALSAYLVKTGLRRRKEATT